MVVQFPFARILVIMFNIIALFSELTAVMQKVRLESDAVCLLCQGSRKRRLVNFLMYSYPDAEPSMKGQLPIMWIPTVLHHT